MFRKCLLSFAAVLGSQGVAMAEPLSFEMVSVGNASNAVDPATGFGSVAYNFEIAKYDVTISDYVAFLNAVAKADPNRLYNPKMASDLMIAGIRREGIYGRFVYSAIAPSGGVQDPSATAGGRPITYVSWFDAARFANWMSNGQPTGRQSARTTENGAYDLTKPAASRGIAVPKNAINPNTHQKPIFYIPSENEWYKAAYYNPDLNEGAGGYTLYATNTTLRPAMLPAAVSIK